MIIRDIHSGQELLTVLQVDYSFWSGATHSFAGSNLVLASHSFQIYSKRNLAFFRFYTFC